MDARSDASASLHDLVGRALQRDQRAWQALVERLKGVAWKVLYGYDMSEEDRKDAFASTFFRLYEHLDTIREIEKLPGWVATTARNEAHTIFRRRKHAVPMDELPLRDPPVVEDPDRLLADELSVALHDAFHRLPPQSQALMRLLTTDPPLAYDEISLILDIPRGSIGPLRQRCLERLRQSPELTPYLNGGSRLT
ncbi:MAG: polymerase subunit sigma-24 [Ilumatobacteraceae bacterium]|nr:polymerase subunit sigma-24 [Ilumatobacteraceae bacterium]